ncbi:hypothetical protein GPALN_011983 [Globodera pallida]|nr:hypothetical protein GPALN_011983 [Globodera pallida]
MDAENERLKHRRLKKEQAEFWEQLSERHERELKSEAYLQALLEGNKRLKSDQFFQAKEVVRLTATVTEQAEQIQKLQEENQRLREENQRLREENRRLSKENKDVWDDLKNLLDKNDELVSKIEAQGSEIQQQAEKIGQLENKIEAQDTEIQQLREEKKEQAEKIVQLEDRIVELEQIIERLLQDVQQLREQSEGRSVPVRIGFKRARMQSPGASSSSGQNQQESTGHEGKSLLEELVESGNPPEQQNNDSVPEPIEFVEVGAEQEQQQDKANEPVQKEENVLPRSSESMILAHIMGQQDGPIEPVREEDINVLPLTADTAPVARGGRFLPLLFCVLRRGHLLQLLIFLILLMFVIQPSPSTMSATPAYMSDTSTATMSSIAFEQQPFDRQAFNDGDSKISDEQMDVEPENVLGVVGGDENEQQQMTVTLEEPENVLGVVGGDENEQQQMTVTLEEPENVLGVVGGDENEQQQDGANGTQDQQQEQLGVKSLLDMMIFGCVTNFSTSLEEQSPAPALILARLPSGYNAPKPFARYVKDQLTGQRGVVVSVLVKIVSKNWKSLGEDEKQNYSERAKKIGDELRDNFEKLTDDQKKDLWNKHVEKMNKRRRLQIKRKLHEFYAETNRPKQPLSSYMIFMKERLEKQTEPIKTRDERKKFFGETGQQWGQMTDAEKQPYVAQAQGNIPAYHKEMAEWKQKYANEIQRERQKKVLEVKAEGSVEKEEWSNVDDEEAIHQGKRRQKRGRKPKKTVEEDYVDNAAPKMTET